LPSKAVRSRCEDVADGGMISTTPRSRPLKPNDHVAVSAANRRERAIYCANSPTGKSADHIDHIDHARRKRELKQLVIDQVK
jgi:hypothetical protein